MSVVNKMLKDLEQRGGQSVYEADYVPIESSHAKSKKFSVGVLVVIIGLSIVTWFLLPTQNQATTLGELPESEIVSPISSAKITESTTMLKSAETQIVLSELDQATISSLENAKQADNLIVANGPIIEKDTNQLQSIVAKPAQAEDMQSQSQRLQTRERQTTALQADLIEVSPEQPTSSEPAVFSVSANNKSTSSNSMLEQRIQLSLKNGDTAAALKDLNNLVALEPRNANARKRLASLEFAKSNPKRAAFLLDQGIKLSPKDSSMRLMQARLLFRENRNVQALSLLIEHPRNVIADNDLLSFRAALAEKQKDYLTSLQDYATLLQRQPTNARWMLGLAISQDKQKMHQKAIISYKRVKSSNQLSAQVVSFVDGRLAALVGS